jgi:hypothetical protein
MLIDDFNSEFHINISNGDLKSANANIMHELGRILATERQDFIHLMNECNLKVHEGVDDSDLIDIYFENLPKNKNLALGTSLLVNHYNKIVGFNGENEINDRNVKAGYVALTSYFSNAEGGALDALTTIGAYALSNRNKKKYGVQDTIQKSLDAKKAMAESILGIKKKQMETAQKETAQKAKTKRILIIVGGGLLAASFIGIAIWYFKFKK